MAIPHTTPFDWSSVHRADHRFAASIQTASFRDCRVAILGVPDDTGVIMNDGRRGARDGPKAFRKALGAYGGAVDAVSGFDLTTLGIYDAGDVSVAGDEIHHTHERVTNAVAAILEEGMLPILIGGGHDLTSAGVRAVSQRLRAEGKTLGGLNIDPHLDVRERVGSGMSFRRIIEDGEGVVDPECFAEVSLGPFSNSPEHIEWLRERGSQLVFFDGDQHRLYDRFCEVLKVIQKAPNLFASFDLDVLDASVAPGVSALNPMGLMPATASMICRTIGATKGLCYFDLMELSPPHDVEGRTARLAAHLFLSFLAGLAEAE